MCTIRISTDQQDIQYFDAIGNTDQLVAVQVLAPEVKVLPPTHGEHVVVPTEEANVLTAQDVQEVA